ncbi:LamG domain-containing protein [Pontiellaceae bacterium B12227]|nr:LamG domain-containing protein [Pontiellaceae bacterium B12227]
MRKDRCSSVMVSGLSALFLLGTASFANGTINSVPSGGAVFSEDKDGVDFLFTVEYAPAVTHMYYWARPFTVTNGERRYGGYLGLQSQNNGNKIALFSMFGIGMGGIQGDLPGAELNISNNGFDGDPAGKGTQTLAPYDWVENHTYRFRLTSGDEGTNTYLYVHVKDLTTQDEGFLGAIQLESGDWKIKKRPTMFTEVAYGNSPLPNNDYIEIPRMIQDDFTISLWVKTTQEISSASSGWWTGAGLVNGEMTGVVDDFGIQLLGTKACIAVKDTQITSTTDINDDTWHHLVFTRSCSDGAIKLFVDGVQEAEAIAATGSLTAPTALSIGKQLTGRGWFVGQIDDVQIFDDIKDPSEVGAMYAAPHLFVTSQSLVAYYDFETVRSGSVVPDSSGSGHDGLVFGSPRWVPGMVGSGAFESDSWGWDTGSCPTTISYSRVLMETRSLDGEEAQPDPGSYGNYKLQLDVPADAIPGETVGVASYARGNAIVHETGLFREHYIDNNIHRLNWPVRK